MDPWKIKARGGAGSPGEADCAGPDSFLEIETDKSVTMPAPPHVEEDAMPRRVYITRAVLNQYGMTDCCVGCANSTIGGTGISHSEECPRRIEKEMDKRSRTAGVHSGDEVKAPRLHRETRREAQGWVPAHAEVTNGGLVMQTSHLLKTWATTYTVVALSSREAEYFGEVKGICEALGLRRTWASTSASLCAPILWRRRGSPLGRTW